MTNIGKTLPISASLILFYLLAFAPLHLAGASTLIYRSAEMGAPGAWGGLLLAPTQRGGARFEITETTTVDAVGGNLFSYYPSAPPDLFGAIVELSGSSDFPDSSNLSTPDVLRTVTFDATNPSTDLIVPVTPITLQPGWYAIIYGSGLFGSSPSYDNDAQLNNTPVGTPNLITWTSSGWSNLSSFWPRYTVYGTVVPEPSSLILVGTIAVLALRKVRCQMAQRERDFGRKFGAS